MTKHFCDICQQECEPGTWTEEYLDPMHRSLGRNNTAQTEVAVRFSYRNHTTTYAGPPDLCKRCKKNLIIDLIKYTLKLEPQ